MKQPTKPERTVRRDEEGRFTQLPDGKDRHKTRRSHADKKGTTQKDTTKLGGPRSQSDKRYREK